MKIKSTSQSTHRHFGRQCRVTAAGRGEEDGLQRRKLSKSSVSLGSAPTHFLDPPNLLGGPQSPSGTQPQGDPETRGRPEGGGRGPQGHLPSPSGQGRNWGCGNGRFLNNHVEERGSAASQAHRPMAQGQTHLPRRLARHGHGLTSCKPLITRRGNLSRPGLKQAARLLRAPLAGPEFSSVVGLYTAPFSIAQGRGTQRPQRWQCGLH